MSDLLLATDDGRSLRDLEDINFVEGKIQPADANTYLSVCYELRSNLSFLEINSSYYRQYYFLSQLPQFKNLKTLKIVNIERYLILQGFCCAKCFTIVLSVLSPSIIPTKIQYSVSVRVNIHI